MKIKSEFTIIERAIQTIDGFSAVDERIRQQAYPKTGASSIPLSNSARPSGEKYGRRSSEGTREKRASF